MTIPFELNYQDIGEDLLNEDAITKINIAFAEYGAVLLQGFPLKTVDIFSELAKKLIKIPMDYTGGVIVRQPVKDQIYHSTEFPAMFAIPIHNEMAYSANFPKRILFFCLKPSEKGGQTPICNCQGVVQRLSSQLVDAIRTYGVRYIQHLPKESDPYLRGWCETFETDNQHIAQQQAAKAGWSCTWNNDVLEMTSTLSGIRLHPRTGKEVWFNQITGYHSSVVEYILQITPQEYLGDFNPSTSKSKVYKDCTLGNGTPFSKDDIEAIWQAVADETIVFDWQQGDVLFLDNLRFAHGRQPFQGERKILVSFGS